MRAPFTTVIALSLLALPSVAQDGTASLTGKAQSIDGAMLPGTTAVLESELAGTIRSAVADDGAVFRFAGLPAGDYTLSLYQMGFQVLIVKSVHVLDGEQKSIPDLKLAILACEIHPVLGYIRLLSSGDNSGNLGGTVRLDSGYGRTPIAGADVTLICGAGRVCGAAKTDSNGDFLFGALPPGNVSVQVNRAGFYPQSEPGYSVEPERERIYSPIYMERCTQGNCDPKLRPEKGIVVCE
jgi:hypothetical protein